MRSAKPLELLALSAGLPPFFIARGGPLLQQLMAAIDQYWNVTAAAQFVSPTAVPHLPTLLELARATGWGHLIDAFEMGAPTEAWATAVRPERLVSAARIPCSTVTQIQFWFDALFGVKASISVSAPARDSSQLNVHVESPVPDNESTVDQMLGIINELCPAHLHFARECLHFHDHP